MSSQQLTSLFHTQWVAKILDTSIEDLANDIVSSRWLSEDRSAAPRALPYLARGSKLWNEYLVAFFLNEGNLFGEHKVRLQFVEAQNKMRRAIIWAFNIGKSKKSLTMDVTWLIDVLAMTWGRRNKQCADIYVSDGEGEEELNSTKDAASCVLDAVRYIIENFNFSKDLKSNPTLDFSALYAAIKEIISQINMHFGYFAIWQHSFDWKMEKPNEPVFDDYHILRSGGVLDLSDGCEGESKGSAASVLWSLAVFVQEYMPVLSEKLSNVNFSIGNSEALDGKVNKANLSRIGRIETCLDDVLYRLIRIVRNQGLPVVNFNESKEISAIINYLRASNPDLVEAQRSYVEHMGQHVIASSNCFRYSSEENPFTLLDALAVGDACFDEVAINA